MPVYTIEGPDNRTFNIEGPAGVSEKDLFAAVQQHIQQEERAAKKAERQSEIAALRKQAEEAALQAEKPIPEGGFKAAFGAGKEQAIADATRLLGRTGVMNTEEAEASAQAREKKVGETFKGTEEGWLENPWLKFKETLGGSLPYVIAPAAAAAATAALPLTGTAATVGAAGAATLASLGQFTGSNLTTQVKGETESGVAGKNLADTNLANALAAAVPQALLDTAANMFMPGIQKVFRRAGKEITEDAAKAIAERTLRQKAVDYGLGITKTAGIQGGTEAAQEYLNRLQAGLPTDNQQAYDSYVENFIGGAVLGGVGRAILPESKGKVAEKPAGETTPQYTSQGDMFPDELRQAQETVSGMQGPAAPEAPAPVEPTPTGPAPQQGELDLGGQDLFGAAPFQPEPIAPENMQLPGTTSEATAEQGAAPAGQGALPLVGGRTAQQASIENYVAQQNADAVGYAQIQREERERIAREQNTTATKLKEQARLKFESDLTEQLNQLESTRDKTEEQARLAVLLPLIENPGITNIPKAFDRALRTMGGFNPQFTERERSLIQRAYDVRGAEDQTTRPTDRTPNEMDVYKESRQEPQQIGLPGFAAPKGSRAAPVAEEPAAPESDMTVDQASVDYLFLPKIAAVGKKILGKDLSNPADRAIVVEELQKARNEYAKRSDPRSRTTVKRINEILSQSPFIRSQGELRGPRGGVFAPYPQPKTTRLYRAESSPNDSKSSIPDWAKDSEGYRNTLAASNRWFTDDINEANWYLKNEYPGGRLTFIDVPTADVEQYRISNLQNKTGGKDAKDNPAAYSRRPEVEFFIPSDLANTRKDYVGRTKKTDNASVEKKTTPAATPAAATPAPAAETPAPVEKKTTPKTEPKAAPTHPASKRPGLVTEALVATMNSKGMHGIKDAGLRKVLADAGIVDKQGVTDRGMELVRKLSGKSLPNGQSMTADRVAGFINEALANTAENLIPPNAKNLEAEFVSPLAAALDANTVSALRSNNLGAALTNLAANLRGILNTFAKALPKLLSGVQVKVVDNLKDASGKAVPGMFDPDTNTLMLDSKTGMNSHTLLHEAGHAALHKILDSKSGAFYTQMKKLFDDVKGVLNTSYGARDIHEFASEAMSNNGFRMQLSMIHPDGSQINALQKFYNIVRNIFRGLMGMKSQSIETALDRADKALMSVLDPNSNLKTAADVYARGIGGDLNAMFEGGIRPILENIPGLNRERVDNIHRFFASTAPNLTKAAVRMSLPLQALVDVARSKIPMADKILDLIKLHNGGVDKITKMLEPIRNQFSDWQKKQTQEMIDRFDTMVSESTLQKVDPSKTAEEAAESYKADPDKVQIWKDMQPEWNKLGKDGQKIYTDMRDAYKTLYRKIVDLTEIRLTDKFGNEGKAINGAVQKLIEARGLIDPYFPLARKGNFWLSYNLYNEKTNTFEHALEAFETPAARDREIALAEATAAEMQEKANKDPNIKAGDPRLDATARLGIERYSKLTNASFRDAPSGSFINSLFKTLEANNVDDDLKEQIMNLYINALPESSLAQTLRVRKGTLGFKTDAIAVFADRAYNLGRQITNIEYGARLAQARAELQEYAKERKTDDVIAGYADELSKRIDFAINPDVSNLSRVATSFGFAWTLGGNISAAVVNGLQTVVVTLPYLSGRYGWRESMTALTSAGRTFFGSGLSMQQVDLLGNNSKIKAGLSMENIDFSDPKLPKELKQLETLVSVAGERGQLNRSLTYDMLAVSDKGAQANINKVLGWTFHQTEKFNRQVALIAAYNLELNRLEKKPKDFEKSMNASQREVAAAEQAVYLADMTNGGVAANEAPRIAQNSLGRVLLMYKRYGATMYYLQFKTAFDALHALNPADRVEAKKQIAGIFGSAALMTGVRGVPMFGIAAMAYDLFKDKEDDDLETAVRKYVKETAYNGALTGLTGMEIGSRGRLNDLIFKQDNFNEPGTANWFIEKVGGPVVSTAKRVYKGFEAIQEGYIQRGVEQMLPSGMGNAFKAMRYATEGTQTRRGDVITGEVSAWNVAGQALGFAPADYVRQNELNQFEKSKDKRIGEERTALLQRANVSLHQNDTDTFSETMEAIQKYNQLHPNKAITMDTMRQSRQQFMKKTASMVNGVTYDPKRRAEILADLAEFDD